MITNDASHIISIGHDEYIEIFNNTYKQLEAKLNKNNY